MNFVRRYWEGLLLVAVILVALDMSLSTLLPCQPISDAAHAEIKSQNGQNCGYFDGPLLSSLSWLIDFIDAHDGFFVVLFTAGLVAFTAALWRSTDKLWEAGERQIATVQRAFVFGRKINADVAFTRSGTGLYVKCILAKVWENSGTTPAMNVSIRENYKAFPSGIPDGFQYPDDPNNPVETVVIGPKAYIVSRGINIHPDDLHAAMDGKTRLFMWGWAEYDDIFQITPRHRTEFCNELIPDGFNVAIEQREIRSRVYGRYNGADENCYKKIQTPGAK